MSERISTDDVAHVARLSRLALTPDELLQATAELDDMLDHFSDIDELNLDDVDPMNQPLPVVNVMRDDVVGATLDRDAVMAEAPAADDGQFRVPPMGAAE